MPAVFLRPRPVVRTPGGRPLQLRDVAEVHAADVELARRLGELPVAAAPAAGRWRVLPLPELLAAVAAAEPAADLRVLGSEDVVLHGERPAGPLGPLVAVAAWLLLLVGAAAALLNFHADVNMPAAHRELYRLLTGHPAERAPVLEIPYAVGVGAGVLLFFRPRRRGEPGPLELETARYERSLQAYLRERP